MPMAQANAVRGVKTYNQPVIRKFRGTVASGVVTAVSGECDDGFSCGTFTSGVATLTFPKCRRATFLNGYVYNQDSVTEAAMQILLPGSPPSASAGTLVIVTENLDATPTTETPEDGDTIEVILLLDEG